MPKLIAISGSIGSGKSTICKKFRRLGIPVFDCDVEAKNIIENQKLFELVSFRGSNGESLLNDPKRLDYLNKTVHPLLFKKWDHFIYKNKYAPVIVCDIPLLFETRQEKYFDFVVVVSCPTFILTQRVIARGKTKEYAKQILSRQLPRQIKERKADFVIHTGLGHAWSNRQFRKLIRLLGCEKEF